MAHTPGPWTLKMGAPRYSINSGNRHVAMVSCYVEIATDEQENIANAHLVAAAPDLLAACETSLGFLDLMRAKLQASELEEVGFCPACTDEGLCYLHQQVEDVITAMTQTRCAIAKAREES